MAFETGTATSLDDLITKLDTFAAANGWTSDELSTVNGIFAMHKNSCYVSMRYDPAAEQVLSIHQALAWTVSTEPGDHTDDSGNGYNDTTAHTNTLLDGERHVDLQSNGPYVSYHFFEQDAAGVFYIHVVVEISTNVFRHFGFGIIEKFGDWDGGSGGEYVYGHAFLTAGGALSDENCTILDGGCFDTGFNKEHMQATIHLEGLPGEPASSKWGNVWAHDGTQPPDSASNAKVFVQGGFRSGPVATSLGWLSSEVSSGLIPMYPIHVFYVDTTANFAYYLGSQQDVRGINIKNFAAKQEVTVGVDVWVVFPFSLKATTGADATQNSGIAYKKVTT